MSDLNQLIETSTGFCSLGAANEEMVSEAEKTLKVFFADDYRQYVISFGAASFNGRELTGVCKSERLNVVSATERARQFYSGFPSDMYVVEELGFDHFITVQDKEGTIYCLGEDNEIKRIASSLTDYLFNGLE